MHVLRGYGFRIYKNDEFQKAKKNGAKLPERYVVLGLQYPSLYGTGGKKEGYIYDRGVETIVECKLQDGSGSVDEKFPHIVRCWRDQSIPNYIVVLEGRWWSTPPRGPRAAAWLRQDVLTPRPDGGRLLVCIGMAEWSDLVDRLFKDGVADLSPSMRDETPDEPATRDLFS